MLQSPNVVAQRGIKQVGQIVSAERGTSITMCGIINAIGNVVPPAYFSRARFRDTMLAGAPVGSLGLANSPSSGWMTSDLFIKVLEHIVKITSCSINNPILIVMDNHETHCSLSAVLYARENGITLVTFPPHTSHRLQPLDVTVYGPFKTKLAVAMNNWMISHPGRTITIHDLCSLVNPAFEATFTIKNITEGFRTTGIWPFNNLVFSDDDFDGAFVTDRHEPMGEQLEQQSETETKLLELENSSVSTTSFFVTDECNNKILPTATSTNKLNLTPITPEHIRPLPKALPRKKSNILRKKGKSRILTETPEKDQIEQEAIAREQKKTSSNSKKSKVKKAKLKKKLFKLPKNVESSSTEESETEIIYDDSTDTEEFSDENLNLSINSNLSKSQVKSKLALRRGTQSANSGANFEDPDAECIFCNELYSASHANEKWILCIICKKWAHCQCADVSYGIKKYICDLCL